MQVTFGKSRDGAPMARVEGVVAFVDRRDPRGKQVRPGETWEVEVAGRNKSGTVIFLRLLKSPAELEAERAKAAQAVREQSRAAAQRALALWDAQWQKAGVPQEEYRRLRERLEKAIESPPLSHYLESEVKDSLEYWPLTRKVIELLKQGAEEVPPPPAVPNVPLKPLELPQGGELVCLFVGTKVEVNKWEGARAIRPLTGQIYQCTRRMGAWVTEWIETSLLGETEYSLGYRWDPTIEVLEPVELQGVAPDHPVVEEFYSTYASRWEAWVDYEVAREVCEQEFAAFREARATYEGQPLTPAQKLNGFGYYGRVWEEDGVVMTLSPEGYPMRVTVGHLRWIVS